MKCPTTPVDIGGAMSDETPVIICTRHPDWENTFMMFGGEAKVYDIDLGRSDLRDEDEFADWAQSHFQEVRELREAGQLNAAKYYEETILDTAQNQADLSISTIGQLTAWLEQKSVSC